MLWWHRSESWSIRHTSIGVGYDLNLHTVRIEEGQHLLIESFLGPLHRKALIGQPLLPVFERRSGNTEGNLRHFAGAWVPRGGVRPRKEREDGSRRPGV